MGLLSLPPELLAHIMHHLHVTDLWQLTLCCMVLAVLGLSHNVLSAQIRGYQSPLLRISPSADPLRLDLQGRRDLLRTELDMSLGQLDSTSLSEAVALRVISLSCRFEAIVNQTTAQIWDRYTRQLLVTESLQIHGGPIYHQEVWCSDALYLTDTCLIISRASSSKLQVECIDFTRGPPSARNKDGTEPLASFSHRVLTYEMGPGRIRLRFDTWQNRMTVCQYGQHSFQEWQDIEWQDPLKSSYLPQNIDYWDIPILLTGEGQGPSLSISRLGALDDYKGWTLFISEEAECQGIPGAHIVLPSEHKPLGNLPRRRRSPKKWHARAENIGCRLDILDTEWLNAYDTASKSRQQVLGHPPKLQFIPLGRPWYVHVLDSRNLVSFKWPTGAEFHFSGSDDEEIECRYVGGLFGFQDGRGNAWLARRGTSALKQFQHHDKSNFSLWELFANRPRVSVTDWN